MYVGLLPRSFRGGKFTLHTYLPGIRACVRLTFSFVFFAGNEAWILNFTYGVCGVEGVLLLGGWMGVLMVMVMVMVTVMALGYVWVGIGMVHSGALACVNAILYCTILSLFSLSRFQSFL